MVATAAHRRWARPARCRPRSAATAAQSLSSGQSPCRCQPICKHLPKNLKNTCGPAPPFLLAVALDQDSHNLKNPAVWPPNNLETARPKNLKNNTHWGDDVTLETHWSGHHGRSLVGLSVALAQDPDSGLIDPSTRRDTASDTVLEFLDFFRKNGGPPLRYLAFDSRVTTYANLSQLNRDGVLFVTVRRRGKRLLQQARKIAPQDRRRIRVPVHNRTRTVEAHDARVRLRGYQGELRQITLLRGHSRRPALLLTNDLHSPMPAILRRYARRWLVEKSISEQLAFFHLNRLSSSMVIKVDFDLAMTVTAYNLYRLLALDLPPGHSHMTARTLFERMLSTRATVRLAEDTCVVTLRKKRNLPALLETLQARKPVRIPWIGNRRIVYEGDTRS